MPDRRLFQRIALLLLGLTLVGCGARPVAQFAPPAEAATPQLIYVATGRDLAPDGPAFGAKRPEKMSYARLTVSVPPTHVTGQIEWPDATPDAATDFVITDSRRFSGAPAMLADLARNNPGRETLLYVHGYNNTMSEAAYRLAQIKQDFGTREPSVLFAWPSAGDPRGYIYDRDSVLFARDDLVRTLRAMTAGERDVFILAHSMGAALTMEALRQVAIGGERRLLDRISGVVLMSPDIDPDLFRRQARAIGALPQPFVIFTSQQDRVLSLAGFLTGSKQRLGVIDSPESVAGLDVQVLDFSKLGDQRGINHAVAVTSPRAVRVLRGMIAQAEATGTGFDRYMVLNAAQ